MIELENPGDGQQISVEYEGWTAITYVDVEPTGIDRLTSSQSGQMLLGGFVLAGLLIGLLLLIVRKNSVAEPHWDDEYDILPNSGAEDVVVVPVVRTASSQPLSRRSRRRLSHQRQQERIRAMEDATEAISENVESVVETTQSSGGLQAIDGTVQGQTGWYQTAQGESQYWQVDGSGQWTRVK